VFDVVGMPDTQHAWDARTDESRYARWHDAEGKHVYPDHKTTRANAADDLLTTAEDYGRFGAWVMAGAGLPPALFEEMVKPQAQLRENHAMGLGWEVHSNFTGGEYALIHSGADRGVHAVIIILPKSKQGVVILTNGDAGPRVYERVITETLDLGREIMMRARR
jgi:CubicO group peptidase (beta-lactamase class C family)